MTTAGALTYTYSTAEAQQKDDMGDSCAGKVPPPSLCHMFYVQCCHSQIAAVYILLECKVLICDDS